MKLKLFLFLIILFLQIPTSANAGFIAGVVTAKVLSNSSGDTPTHEQEGKSLISTDGNICKCVSADMTSRQCRIYGRFTTLEGYKNDTHYYSRNLTKIPLKTILGMRLEKFTNNKVTYTKTDFIYTPLFYLASFEDTVRYCAQDMSSKLKAVAIFDKEVYLSY